MQSICSMKESWEIKKLGDCCNIQTGKLDANARVENGKYPFYTCDSQPYRIDTYAFDAEAILISGNGSLVGHVNYYNGKFNAYQRTYVLTEFSSFYIPYLIHFLKQYIRPYIMKNKKGGCIPYITLPILKNFLIPCPPLPEQESIVAELDCLSGVIEKQKRQLKELDNLAQSIFYTTFGDPISNNFGWKNRRLGEIVNSNMIGLTRSGSEQDASYEYLYFKMNNIGNEGGVDWSKTTRVNACAQEVEKYTLKEGDFLFNTRNSFELVGKTCIYPRIDGEVCLFNNNIMRIDFKKEINVTYMAYLFQDKYIKNQLDRIKKGTTSVWAIYYKDLEKIDILVPDIALQEEFASKVAAIEKQKVTIKQSIEETETLFNSRMDYYFN